MNVVQTQSEHTSANSNNSVGGDGTGGGTGTASNSELGFGVGQQPSVTLTIRLIMQGKEVGSIIGKKGDNIKRFREESGAKITISDGSCPERIVTVTGSTESILKAFAMIARKFEEDANNSNLVMNTNFNIPNAASATTAGQNGKTLCSMPVTLKLIVPASQCGSLIGKGGSKIKEIREITGASIQVASEMLPNSTERAVTLSGTAESITKSIYQICCVMLESPPKGPTIPYRPKPAMPPVFFAGGQAYTIQGQFAIPHPDAFNAPISSTTPYFDSAAQSCALQHQAAVALLSQHFSQLTGNHHHHQQQQQSQQQPTPQPPPPPLHGANHSAVAAAAAAAQLASVIQQQQQQQQQQSGHLNHHQPVDCSSPQPQQQQNHSTQLSPVSSVAGANSIAGPNHHHHQPAPTIGAGDQSHPHQHHHHSNAQQSSPNGMLASHAFLDTISPTQYSPGFLTKLHRLALQHAPLLPGQAVGSLNPQATLATLAANSAATLGHHTSAATSNTGMVPTLTTEMTISNDIIGSVIGKGGSKINEIRQLSGATIKINSSEEGTKDRTITISGTPEAINLAQYLIATSSNGLLNSLNNLSNTGSLVTSATNTQINSSSTGGGINSLNTMAAVAAAAAVSNNKLYVGSGAGGSSGASKHSLSSLNASNLSNGGSSSKSNKNDRKYAPY